MGVNFGISAITARACLAVWHPGCARWCTRCGGTGWVVPGVRGGTGHVRMVVGPRGMGPGASLQQFPTVTPQWSRYSPSTATVVPVQPSGGPGTAQWWSPYSPVVVPVQLSGGTERSLVVVQREVPSGGIEVPSGVTEARWCYRGPVVLQRPRWW